MNVSIICQCQSFDIHCYYEQTYMLLPLRLSPNVAIRSACAFALLLLGAADGRSQSSVPPARAVQIPLSGQSSSGATVQQISVPNAGSSVTTLNSQVQVRAPYNGSVPGQDNPQGTITLTLQEAVRRGLTMHRGRPTPNDSRPAAPSYRRSAQLYRKTR